MLAAESWTLVPRPVENPVNFEGGGLAAGPVATTAVVWFATVGAGGASSAETAVVRSISAATMLVAEGTTLSPRAVLKPPNVGSPPTPRTRGTNASAAAALATGCRGAASSNALEEMVSSPRRLIAAARRPLEMCVSDPPAVLKPVNAAGAVCRALRSPGGLRGGGSDGSDGSGGGGGGGRSSTTASLCADAAGFEAAREGCFAPSVRCSSSAARVLSGAGGGSARSCDRPPLSASCDDSTS